VVPYTRGPELSRPPAHIEAEVRVLVENGAREITLLGQNVNAYRARGEDGEAWSLARLIAYLAHIDGLQRIRYTTSHPREMSDELIAAHGAIGKLMPFLHLPVQSGSDHVLERMNRRHKADDYLRIVERLRRARPDVAFSSDFIVGFPGESDRDFESTLALIREVGFAQSFSFKYSVRPGTPAASLPGQIPENVKSARLQLLQKLLMEGQDAFNAAALGRIMPVLFEKLGRGPGQAVGRSPFLHPVHVADAAGLIGQIRDVYIEAVTANSLRGTLACVPQKAPVQ
jgi:tRNA-2-methylthio-N6-dimethylallyladenosine synthase